MTVVGLVVEYNPFHRGHEIHMTRARELAGPGGTVICAMSGSFTQRGEPALVSKWARAAMALAMGADVIFEIPVPWVVSSAEGFAAGGVSILEAAGCKKILFGSEGGDLAALERAARVAFTREAEMVERLREPASRGKSYARCAAAFVDEALDFEAGAVEGPNEVLGIAYIVAAKRLGAKVEFETLRRVGAGYNDETLGPDCPASATGIRKLLSSGNPEAVRPFVPEPVWQILKREFQAGLGPVFPESLEVPTLYAARASSLEDFRRVPRVCPGMDFVLFRKCRTAAGLQELMGALKNRSVTMARVRRVLCCLLLGIPREAENWTRGPVPYLRLLGTSPAGRRHLREVRAGAVLPTIVRVSRWRGAIRDFNRKAPEAGVPQVEIEWAERVMALDLLSTDIWSLGVPVRKRRSGGTDFETPPVTID